VAQYWTHGLGYILAIKSYQRGGSMKFTEEEERGLDRWALAITMLIGTPIILVLVNLGVLPVCGG
jgi:hypothetical protein